MDKYWGKAKNGRYICPVCNEKFDEDLLPTGECPNCGFHEQGGLKPKIKGAKYDEGKPRPSLVPVAAIEAIMQVREFGKAKYADAEDWRKVPREKWLDALLRHVLHIWDNPLALDDESGLPALWHVITNAAFLCAAYKDDIDKFYAYAKDLNKDWVWTGPGPDPRGEEGDLGPGVTKEANQCGDASGRGND